MGNLVALDRSGGAEFLRALDRIWANGDAALPVDQRLPAQARSALLTQMRVGEPVESGDALVLATSGTTGAPKGVVLTHAALDAHADAVNEFLSVEPAADRWLACLPLAHIGGLGVVLRARRNRTPVEVLPGFDAAAVAASDSTLVSLVPTVLDRVDVSRFRHILLGGSAIPRDRPANSTATYGLTETGGGVVYDGLPLPGVEVRIDPDAQIELRSPTLLRCYRDGRNPLTSDGWLPTGDIGSITRGVLRVAGRSGDMIITGGENVWPTPVEEILVRHPGILAAAVVGRPSAEWGQQVTAVLELRDTATAPDLEALRAMVKEQLPAFCAPKAIEIVPVLPRTALGKIKRAAL